MGEKGGGSFQKKAHHYANWLLTWNVEEMAGLVEAANARAQQIAAS